MATETLTKNEYHEILEGEEPDPVIDKLAEMHALDAVKIDHVNRGEPQECWSCGDDEDKGFHLFKADTQFFKLCDGCAKSYSTLLARLVQQRNEAARAAEEAAAEEAAAAEAAEEVEASAAEAEEDETDTSDDSSKAEAQEEAETKGA